MAALKVFALGLAVAVATLSSPVRAQDQTFTEPHYKWLDCDISWIFTSETVGPAFSVRITFRNSPVIDTLLTLRGGGKVVFTARTNSDGVARFDKVDPGAYWADSPDGLLFPSVEFKVKADHPLRERVDLEWPIIGNSVAYRFLTGRLTAAENEDSPDIPLRNAVVELREIYTGRLTESVSTDANGEYKFATTDTGLYALRLTLPKKGEAGSDTRDLLIELDPAAKQFSIPEMKVVQSHCAGIELFGRSKTDDRWEEQ